MSLLSELRSSPQSSVMNSLGKKLLDLVLEKVTGYLENPQQYPMPADSRSAERAFYNLVKALPEKREKKFRKKHEDMLKRTAAQRNAHYGKLAGINLHVAIPIADQIKTMDLPAEYRWRKDDDTAIRNILKKHAVKTPVQRTIAKTVKQTPVVPAQASVPPTVDLFVDSITCVKKSELGKDEINLGAFVVDPLGVLQNKEPFFIGKFKKGDTINLPAAGAKLFDLDFNLGSVGEFPQSFAASFFLVEEDIMHNTELADKLSIACFAIWGLGMTAVGVIIGVGMAGGPVTVAMAYVVLAISMTFLVIGLQLIPIIADDISTTETDLLVVDAEPVAAQSIPRSVNVKLENLVGDPTVGEYKINFRWEIVV